MDKLALLIKAQRHNDWGERAVMVGVYIVLAGFVTMVGLLGWQFFDWLRNGDWKSLPAISVGLVWVLDAFDIDNSIRVWAEAPTSWIGLHKLLNWMPVGLLAMVVCIAAAIPFLIWGANLQGIALELRQRVRAHERAAEFGEVQP